MRATLPAAILLGGAVLVSGCATDDPHRRAKTGAAIGAVTGAVIGHQIDHDSGRWVGAAVGALAGGAVGNYMDQQERDFQNALAAEQRANELEIQRMRDETLKLTLDSEVSFPYDSAEIKPAFRPTLDKLADLLQKYNRTTVHIVGHTDSTGPEEYNRQLSERRAYAVLDYLAYRGVARQRLTAEGRGESDPRDTNATEAGRQLNRRVEVFVRPVVEGQQGGSYGSGGYREPTYRETYPPRY
ncbi:MAG: OmpA family protein [Chromatiales bacterium]|jgi:outer membrane protein OmpA-like peptidoglycan-associated protein